MIILEINTYNCYNNSYELITKFNNNSLMSPNSLIQIVHNSSIVNYNS